MWHKYSSSLIYNFLILCALFGFSNNAGIMKPLKDKANVGIFSMSSNDYKKYSEKIGLYYLNDDVEILTVDNFKSELYGNKRAWIIEFYNAWCGFCQRFAPSWKQFATDIKDWKGLVGVGAIDCSDETNTAICREFEIMGYPTLKYFHEMYEEGATNLGLNIKTGGDAAAHKRVLLHTIMDEQTADRGKMFPTLQPFTGSLKDLFTLDNDLAFLVVQQNVSDYVGQEVMMDLHKVKNVNVRYILKNETVLVTKFGVTSFPALVVINKDETHQLLDVKAKAESIKNAIQKYLYPHKTTNSNEELIINREDKHSQNVVNFLDERERARLKDKIKRMGDVVFQMDLESTLRYSLKHEVGLVKEITDERLQALKNYINVLYKYFPFGRNGKLFLHDLKEFVWYKTAVKGSDIANFLKHAEMENQLVFSSPLGQWLGCKGSADNYRGYTCGMWKLFHYLTVNAADEAVGSNPRVVLEAMHGYIKSFFGCYDCSQHFQDLARRRALSNVSSWDDSVLWLWSAHNEVNKRLSGDETEDPEYPKYQFPSKVNCPRCYTKENTWNIPEIFYYLKHVYTSINVRYIGSDTRILHLGLDGSPEYKSEPGFFKTVDTAFCFILYLACFMFILVLIYLFSKRGYKKKAYLHDIHGKV
uniref:Sulfhydryl oxidase n=1 Tax=Diabrotica virgifera virgifera TaxID=50390 RepID=A0A6P7HBE4_DIAVI